MTRRSLGRRAWAWRAAAAVAAALVAGPAAAQGMDAAACAALAERDPAAAVEAARDWGQAGGGGEARVCEALALEAKGAPAAGAAVLERLAARGGAYGYDARRRAGLLEVASGWLLRAERAEAARAAAEGGLALDPGSPRLLTRRAEAGAALGETEAALADLNQAVAAAPGLAEARLLRGRLRLERGEAAGALDDAEAAVATAESDARGWLLAGRALAALGRTGEARERLLGAVARDRAGPVGDAAQGALQRMELD